MRKRYSDTAEEQAGPSEELKVVMPLKEGRATIGVQRPSSDPYLSGLTQEVLAVAERAAAKWEDAPKYPAHERPTPTARRRPRREQGTAQNSTDEETGEPQPEALRLF